MASGPLTRRLPPPPPYLQPVSADHPRCPRCNSQDTKFCYYNNYNLAQPRHFCKSCRRYWTLGGSLRNKPIGGTSRRDTSSSFSYFHNTLKRRRYSGSTPSSPTSSLVAEHNARPTSDVPQRKPITSSYDPDMARNFGALPIEPLPTWFLAIGVTPEPSYGLRFGHGIEGVGFGQLGRTLGPFFGEELDQSSGGGVLRSGNGFCGDTWPVSNGGSFDVTSVRVDDDGCFAWPDLAISITPEEKMGVENAGSCGGGN